MLSTDRASMAPDVLGADEQQDLEIDLARFVALAASALSDEGVSDAAEVSLLFVDEPTIASLNEQFLGKKGPTDVLSFPIDDEGAVSGRTPDSDIGGPPSKEPLDAPSEILLGDIVICPAVASRNAVEHEVTFEAELELLVVHGVLHLLGWDHIIDIEAERMEDRERQILRRHSRESR